ncbi:hypothetical protein CBM2631_B190038 [Cupriavidus taiwanensis]|nr:hypothetical protein CBM2588_B190131 [Cupriavidus taiwanensis]SOZ71796.1 hypothetical protein CBM2617_B180133 [Cupriavidus taiwanensis]SOZ90099.1 hypothetical protein CBM2622_B190132 [Cupriavidus taiwanensis]SOZ94688.1 hypothetical protein CBM2621_B190133 [Cupriavidus taiwanensis]SPA20423.1 hypothetical protein CBM2631_B190038 [Cupriavidus taiwanensis]
MSEAIGASEDCVHITADRRHDRRDAAVVRNMCQSNRGRLGEQLYGEMARISVSSRGHGNRMGLRPEDKVGYRRDS